MITSDLIALLGDYLTILAVVIAFLSTQIESWKNEVRGLEAEWSEPEHKANNLLKLRHESQRRALKTNTPIFPLIAPLVLGVGLLGLGVRALCVAATSVVKGEIELLLFVPSIVLMSVYVIYGVISIQSSKKRLDNLG
jgi:hypothetical protein